jgi:hypothetical protein
MGPHWPGLEQLLFEGVGKAELSAENNELNDFSAEDVEIE